MYTVKPIIDSSIPLSGPLASTMYSVAGAPSFGDKLPAPNADRAIANVADVAQLERRQAVLLQKLDHLNSLLNCMKTVVNASDHKSPAVAQLQGSANNASRTPIAAGEPYQQLQSLLRQKFSHDTPKPVSQANLPEIVINANPAAYIPYSLRVIKTMWQDRVAVQVQTFVHSSIVGGLPQEAIRFQELLAYTRPVSATVKTPLPTLNVTLIWKECEQLELRCASANYQPIVGEPNILRYLYRSGPAEFQWPSYPLGELIVLDQSLDLVHQLAVVAKDAKQRKPIWKELHKVLHSAPQEAGVINAANVAVGSAIRQFREVQRTDEVGEFLVGMYQQVVAFAEYGQQNESKA